MYVSIYHGMVCLQFRVTYRRQFFPSTILVLEIQLRSSGLGTSTFKPAKSFCHLLDLTSDRCAIITEKIVLIKYLICLIFVIY